jgi:YD repeat-containing protein
MLLELTILGNDNLTIAEYGTFVDLTTKNRISEPIQVETYSNNVLQNTVRTHYKDWGGNIVQTEKVETLKGIYDPINNQLDQRLTYHQYDLKGNPTELSKQDGTHIVYIWGYNQTLPIAKIENATFSDIPTTIYNAIIAASNADSDTTTENTLRAELDKLRDASLCPNLTRAMITTYTHDPLIGVTSMTDPREDTVYYRYDAFNRLIEVKDRDGNILSENTYNYKN